MATDGVTVGAEDGSLVTALIGDPHTFGNVDHDTSTTALWCLAPTSSRVARETAPDVMSWTGATLVRATLAERENDRPT
jgi:hypothetical protein